VAQTTAEQVVLGLIRAAGGEWEGKRRLYKGFYFAHLYFAEQNPGLLTDCPIARMPQGPGIHKVSELLSGLTGAGLLEMEKAGRAAARRRGGGRATGRRLLQG
jgi:hypothetical protein